MLYLKGLQEENQSKRKGRGFEMNKGFKKFIAVVCAIAMVVTGVSIQPKAVSAQDYSELTYDYKNSGETYLKGSETTKVPWKVAVDSTQSSGDIVNWMTTGAGQVYFYNDKYMGVQWHGNYPKAVLEINGTVIEAKDAQVFADPEVHVDATKWIENNAYNVVKVTSADGSQWVTFIVATGDKAGGSSEQPGGETTTPETTTPPSTDEWTDASAEWTTDYVWNIWTNPATGAKYKNANALNDYYVSISQGLGQWSVQANTIITGLTAGRKYDYKITVESDLAGAKVGTKEDYTNSPLEYKTLDAGQNELTGSFTAGSENAKLFLELGDAVNKNVTLHVIGVEVTEAAAEEFIEGKELVPDNKQNGTMNVTAVTDGEPYAQEYKSTDITFVSGKYYVAKATITSDVKKRIQIRFQNASNNYDDLTGAGFYNFSIEAGNTVEVTYVFQANQDTSNGIYDFCLGYIDEVNEAANVTFSNVSLKPYTDQPTDVTGVKVISAPSTTCKVTVDGGTPETVEKGSKYTLGDNTYGYTIDGTNYKPGSEITVNEDITVTSINVALTMTDGAGIKLSDPTGIRFQANLDTNASIKESGMLLSAKDFMDAANVTELTTDASVEKVNIPNGTGTGKYIGALVNINNQNYGRDFTARAYVTISYEDSDVTYYSEKSMTRNIKDVANGLINAGKTDGLSDAQKALVNTFAGITE